ncbi:MAG: peptidoglycan DD-metalloendopeptidase family protein [Bermanella sp.]
MSKRLNMASGALRVLLCLVFMATTNPLQAGEPSRGEQHLDKLRNDINELQGYLKKVQASHQALVKALRSSDQEVAEVSKKVEALRSALQEERRRLKKLQAEQRTLSQSQQQQQDTLKNIILASYKLGQQPKLKLLLNQQDASLLSRNLHYLQYFNAAHQTKLLDYRTTLQALEVLTAKVSSQKQNLQSKLAKLKSGRERLKDRQAKQQADARALNRTMNSSDKKLARLQQDRQQLMAVLGKVEEVFLNYERSQESRPFKALRGKLPSPLQHQPKKLFGRLQDNQKQRWLGWLYEARAGSHVTAIHHGRVVFSDWLRGFGLLTIVDHGQGYMSLYARNQALLKSVGDWVESGEVISKLGRSGGYDDDALYFEIRYKGTPQNPKHWLKG